MYIYVCIYIYVYICVYIHIYIYIMGVWQQSARVERKLFPLASVPQTSPLRIFKSIFIKAIGL